MPVEGLLPSQKPVKAITRDHLLLVTGYVLCLTSTIRPTIRASSVSNVAAAIDADENNGVLFIIMVTANIVHIRLPSLVADIES